MIFTGALTVMKKLRGYSCRWSPVKSRSSGGARDKSSSPRYTEVHAWQLQDDEDIFAKVEFVEYVSNMCTS